MSLFVYIVLRQHWFYSLPNIQNGVWLPSLFVYFVQTVPTKPAQLATVPNSVLKQSRLVPSPHVPGDQWKQEREGDREREREKPSQRQTGPAAVCKNKTHDKSKHFRARGSSQACSSAWKGPIVFRAPESHNAAWPLVWVKLLFASFILMAVTASPGSGTKRPTLLELSGTAPASLPSPVLQPD